MTRHRLLHILLVLIVVTWISSSSEAQSPRAKLDGMWSDPPATVWGRSALMHVRMPELIG